MSEASEEAERRIVTTCCDYPDAIERVDCSAEDFGCLKWRACYRALVELYSEDQEPDPLLLMEAVVKKHSGAVTLAELSNIDGLPSMIEAYSAIVRTESARRRLKLGLSTVMATLDQEAPEAILESLGAMARESWFGETGGAKTIRELAEKRFREYCDIADGSDATIGFDSGIDSLDEVMGGIQPGIVTLIAARPGMGKSTVALNFTAHLSKTVGVHVFSMEEPEAHYTDRVLSLASRISTEVLRLAKLNAGQRDALKVGANRVGLRTGWLVDDRTGIRAEEIVRCVRLRAQENGTRVVVIDYINILKRLPGENKRDMMDLAVNVFADAAKRDGMAYIVLAQLNRGVEGRDTPEPRLSDLKECGTLEERAKAAIMLYHPSEHSDKAPKDVIKLLVVKNSQGRKGAISVRWQPERMFVGDLK